MGEFLLYMVIAVVGFIVYMIIDNSRQNKFQKQTKALWEVDTNNHTVTIYKRHPSLSKMFYYTEYEAKQTKYTKEEYVFTAATVGSVTVGGVDKIGGYSDHKVKTGKYTLSFSYDGSTSTNIKRIYLSDELLKEAKMSSDIYFYLRDNYIEVESNIIEPSSYRMELASPTVRSMLETEAITKALPSKEKCKAIISWLGTPLSQQFKSSDTLTEKEKEHIYKEAVILSTSLNSSELEEAHAKFTYLKKWNDSENQAKIISEKLTELKAPEFYSQAIDSFNQKKFETAIEYFSKCIDYKDSKEYHTKCQNKIKSKNNKKRLISLLLIVVFGTCSVFIMKINSDSSKQKDSEYRQQLEQTFMETKIGSTISFGKYQQTGNEKTPIQWTVIEKTDDSIFLLANNVLDYQKYGGDSGNSGSWDTCSLRKWLNGTFLYAAFSTTEQEFIKESELNTSGLITTDKIFILSREEYNNCPTNKRIAPITSYVANKVDNAKEGMVLGNLLRDNKKILHVTPDGSLDYRWDVETGIRPALWINIVSNVNN